MAAPFLSADHKTQRGRKGAWLAMDTARLLVRL